MEPHPLIRQDPAQLAVVVDLAVEHQGNPSIIAAHRLAPAGDVDDRKPAVRAVPEVVGTSSAARLVAPESAAALADAIEQAITQGDSPAAAAARRDVVSRFSLERRVEAHLKLYRELFEAQAGVTPACVALPAQ